MSARPMLLNQGSDSGVIDDFSGNFLPQISPGRRGPAPFDFGDGSDTDEGEEANDKVEEIYR